MILSKQNHIENVYSLSRATNSIQQHFGKEYVRNSWERCIKDHDMSPGATYRPRVLTSTRLREHQELLDKFLRISQPWMERLYQQVASQGKMLLLTNSEGVTLDYVENNEFSKCSEIPAPVLGSVLTERHEGTNGVGMCLHLRKPLIINKTDHFRASHINLTCTVSPIFSPRSEIFAVLNISSTDPSETDIDHFQTLQLVNVFARMIENVNFLAEFEREWVLSLSPGPEFTGVITESLLAINEDGRILAIDQGSCQKLQLKDGSLFVDRPISELFDISLDDLMRRADPLANIKWPIRVKEFGAQFYATLRAPEEIRSCKSKKIASSGVASAKSAPLGSSLTLENLAGQDPQMIYNVSCIRRVMNKNIPIILHGETGTGKEAFARAIHSASNRSSRPFIAVNCASIPESLIESELFGYEAGSFTGANSKGKRGKILQSDGGTLFLDEIGDMPLELQTRLLRILSEKEVSPLGSEVPVPVDLHVLCATHRNIKELVRTGGFREDLYYRLNGVTLKLPALHERTDRAALIEFAFTVEAGDNLDKIQIGEEAIRVLMNYSWPGNVRQLRNALRFALAINESGTITPQDLPPETILATDYSRPYESVSKDGDDLDFLELSAMEKSERAAVLGALENNKWKVAAASDDLGLARATMYRKMKKYNLIPPNER